MPREKAALKALPARARCGDARARRSSRVAAPVAAAPLLHQPDREPGAPEPAVELRHHAAALRPDGAARARPAGPEDERALPAHDGDRRQRHRHHRRPGEGRAGRARGRHRRPPRLSRQADRRGRAPVPPHGRRARALGRRSLRRPLAAAEEAADGPPGRAQGAPAGVDGAEHEPHARTHSIPRPTRRGISNGACRSGSAW